MSGPAVSVVIPTRGRPDLLRRALASVVAQTFADLELVVVVDGPDPASEALLRTEPDPRLQYVVHATVRGGGAARNTGVRRARAPWIAFLDDDDLWLPEKLERQMAGLGSPDAVIGFTRFIARAPHGDYIWPRRPPRPGEHISDYLFVRRSLFAGEGGIQTSTMVTSRELLLAHPFDESLRRLQDTDWQLRAVAAGARLAFCPDPLTVWHIEQRRPSITAAHASSWDQLIDWIEERRHLVTPRAYAAFLLLRGGAATAAAKDWRGAARTWRLAWRHGRPGLLETALFLGKWAAPASLRVALRSRLSPGRAPPP